MFSLARLSIWLRYFTQKMACRETSKDIWWMIGDTQTYCYKIR
jgi:hypothetical protein